MPKAKSMSLRDSLDPNGAPLPLDPIIEGLLDRLPEYGSVWPKSKREAWLNILRQSFDLLYEDGGEVKAQPRDASMPPPRPPGANVA